MKGKHKGSQTTYIDDRNAALIEAYRRAKARLLDEKGFFLRDEALDLARLTPTPRYYISEQRASIIITQLLKLDDYLTLLQSRQHSSAAPAPVPCGFAAGLPAPVPAASAAGSPPSELPPRPADPLAPMLYQRRRMYSHLFMQYKSLRREHPDWSHEELVTVACASPAHEFYLTIDSTREIISRITRTRRK